MFYLYRMTPLVSAATLALVIGQSAFAEEPAPAAASPAEAAPAAAPPAAPEAASSTQSPGDAARAQAEERRAAMMAERQKRYEELRASAAEIGLALPEDPWSSVPPMPEPPAMPERRGMSPDDMEAMREQRRKMREQMQAMTPEERRAMRDAHWQQMRADAAERGIEMPETPPWAAAEQRRKEMDEQFEQYRKTIEALSEEQLEAARALFGGRPPMPEHPGMPPHMSPEGYGYGPQGGYPGPMPYQGGPGPMGGHPPMMPYFGAPREEQAPAPQGPVN